MLWTFMSIKQLKKRVQVLCLEGNANGCAKGTWAPRGGGAAGRQGDYRGLMVLCLGTRRRHQAARAAPHLEMDQKNEG